MSKTLGIIPARKGSKGLPNKNIKLINNKPLINWTIDQANKSNLLDKCIVSTDSEEIAKIARKAGGEVPFLRPPHLSNDTATSISVVEHALKYLQEECSECFDNIILLEPTSPIRMDYDIDNMIEKLYINYEKHDAVVSIGDVKTHPAYIKKIDKNGILMSFNKNNKSEERRQDQDRAFFPFGVGYLSKISSLLKKQTFYPHQSYGYILNSIQCYEIDDMSDFICVEAIMKYHNF